MSSKRFENKTIIVTGAAGGIGEAYARALAAEGANVVVADLADEKGKQVAADIGGLYVSTDVADEDSAKALAAATVDAYGSVDGLVNNAAIYGGMKLDFLITVPWDYYKKFMSVNLDGALNVTRAVYPHMTNGGGAIVNQSSTAAWLYSGFYGLAKVGVNGLTQQLATELGGQNIRVNAIAPGPIDTEATRTTTPKEMVADIVNRLPLKRFGTPEDLVGMCLFLLSDEAGWITGQIFNVDGGQDYRRLKMEKLKVYHVARPGGADPAPEMTRIFEELKDTEEERQPLDIEGRRIPYRKRAGGLVWFDFEALCGGPRSYADYVDLARRFHTVMLSGVPRMGPRNADAARRFTWLVDVFYDDRVKLVVSAAAPPEDLFTDGGEGARTAAAEFQRTASRLHEMQSVDYLKQERARR